MLAVEQLKFLYLVSADLKNLKNIASTTNFERLTTLKGIRLGAA